MNKVSDVKRKKVPTKKPSATPSAPARRILTVPSYDATTTTDEVFDETSGSCGSNDAAAEFVHLLATNAVDIDQAPIGGFDYNELEGGVDDHSGEDEVEEIDEGAYQQSQVKYLDAKIELAEKKARKKQERWKFLKEVEERKSRAAENKTMANLLAEENRIITLNRNDMDD
ncbi:putative galacturonosyltransferase 14 [Hordeum vulgare]|nr:putative galacturonosyltransferase 14 [Hordeum vulgare]